VWIEVRDTGIGIDAEDQERLFNKFFRTRAATKASIQGTGLGLAISKAIVQAHGGSIHVESAEGEGTTFRVELPVGVRAPSPASAPTVNA
jgi:signal transduction histidine kinase